MPAPSRWTALARFFKPTFSYWMETEVHVYAFSIAANVLLSFFPFLIVVWYVCRQVLGWHGAVNAIDFALDTYLPGELTNFMHRNLLDTVARRGSVQAISILLLLFTANGIFEPLEVALNRAWGIKTNRSFLKNQIISLGLIFACGSLALASTVLSGVNIKVFHDDPSAQLMSTVVMKAAALPVSILMLFLIYWLLPNAKIGWRSALPSAAFAGMALEALKYLNILTWPLWRLKLEPEYGPFFRSVTIILWSFLGSMVVLAGAEWAARRHRAVCAP